MFQEREKNSIKTISIHLSRVSDDFKFFIDKIRNEMNLQYEYSTWASAIQYADHV